MRLNEEELRPMIVDRNTIHRPRRTKNRSFAKDMAFSFWVGQHVVRTGDRRNYQDEAVEFGRVVALPAEQGKPLMVEIIRWEPNTPVVGEGELHWWDDLECRPVREWLRVNAQRLRARASHLSNFAKNSLDENGARKEQD